MPTDTTAQVGERVMTTDELRDWHAREAGWEFKYNSWWHPTIQALYHPYSATLDCAASAMPEGFVWVREYSTSSDYEKYEKGLVLTWNAYGQHEEAVKCDDTGDEIHDRYLLAKLVKEAMNAQSR